MVTVISAVVFGQRVRFRLVGQSVAAGNGYELGKLGRRCLAVAVLLMLPSLGTTYEVTITAPGAPEDLVKRLERGSLSVVLSEDDESEHTSAEILAAARSDYNTIIAILYDTGYFSPTISIKVDGQEAANIAPLLAPASIQRVNINVETGRPFVFGRADIGPLAPETELPD